MSRRSQKAARVPTWLIIVFIILLLIAPLAFVLLTSTKSNSQDPMDEYSLGTVIGIDLGEKQSSAAIMRDGEVEILAKIEAGRIRPLPVNRLPSSGWPLSKIMGFKWQKFFNNTPAFVEPSLEPRAENDEITVEGSAGVLARLKDMAEAQIGEKVDNAVVSGEDAHGLVLGVSH